MEAIAAAHGKVDLEGESGITALEELHLLMVTWFKEIARGNRVTLDIAAGGDTISLVFNRGGDHDTTRDRVINASRTILIGQASSVRWLAPNRIVFTSEGGDCVIQNGTKRMKQDAFEQFFATLIASIMDIRKLSVYLGHTTSGWDNDSTQNVLKEACMFTNAVLRGGRMWQKWWLQLFTLLLEERAGTNVVNGAGAACWDDNGAGDNIGRQTPNVLPPVGPPAPLSDDPATIVTSRSVMPGLPPLIAAGSLGPNNFGVNIPFAPVGAICSLGQFGLKWSHPEKWRTWVDAVTAAWWNIPAGAGPVPGAVPPCPSGNDAAMVSCYLNNQVDGILPPIEDTIILPNLTDSESWSVQRLQKMARVFGSRRAVHRVTAAGAGAGANRCVAPATCEVKRFTHILLVRSTHTPADLGGQPAALGVMAPTLTLAEWSLMAATTGDVAGIFDGLRSVLTKVFQFRITPHPAAGANPLAAGDPQHGIPPSADIAADGGILVTPSGAWRKFSTFTHDMSILLLAGLYVPPKWNTLRMFDWVGLANQLGRWDPLMAFADVSSTMALVMQDVIRDVQVRVWDSGVQTDEAEMVRGTITNMTIDAIDVGQEGGEAGSVSGLDTTSFEMTTTQAAARRMLGVGLIGDSVMFDCLSYDTDQERGYAQVLPQSSGVFWTTWLDLADRSHNVPPSQKPMKRTDIIEMLSKLKWQLGSTLRIGDTATPMAEDEVYVVEVGGRRCEAAMAIKAVTALGGGVATRIGAGPGVVPCPDGTIEYVYVLPTNGNEVGPWADLLLDFDPSGHVIPNSYTVVGSDGAGGFDKNFRIALSAPNVANLRATIGTMRAGGGNNVDILSRSDDASTVAKIASSFLKVKNAVKLPEGKVVQSKAPPSDKPAHIDSKPATPAAKPAITKPVDDGIKNAPVDDTNVTGMAQVTPP
jgi:hypothetical protein